MWYNSSEEDEDETQTASAARGRQNHPTTDPRMPDQINSARKVTMTRPHEWCLADQSQKPMCSFCRNVSCCYRDVMLDTHDIIHRLLTEEMPCPSPTPLSPPRLRRVRVALRMQEQQENSVRNQLTSQASEIDLMVNPGPTEHGPDAASNITEWMDANEYCHRKPMGSTPDSTNKRMGSSQSATTQHEQLEPDTSTMKISTADLSNSDGTLPHSHP